MMILVLLVWMNALSFGQGSSDAQEKEVPTYEKSEKYPFVPNSTFLPGEEIEFKATFGWFNVGKATLKVNDQIYTKNGRACYKVDAVGKTTGLVDWLAKVDDYWGAYIDTTSMISQEFTRIISEGNYRKHEITDFDHIKDSVAVKAYSYRRESWTDWEKFDAPNNIRDMLSGYFFLRNVDFSKKSKGDTIQVYGFLEDTIYDLTVVYEGKEKIRTKAGTFMTYKIVPLMPENSLFDGEDSIIAWISADENKIPVKVSAKMFIGHAGVELTGFKNLRHDPNILK